MKKFPEFYYESNSCWGWVRSMEDLQEKVNQQTEPIYGGLNNLDEFLDYSKLDIYSPESVCFGTRIEHRGKKTLREYLIENNVDISLLK